MKKSFSKGISVALLALLFVAGTAQNSQAQDVSVSYQTFYDNLSPYGQWVNDRQYGNVWVPNEGGDFRPYGSRGHWVMTDYGNTWVSEDPWGWAVYHYGRWTYDNYYGWVWVPGYEWAPAWVSWRYGGGYSGWAPLGPGINVGYSNGCPDSWWVFVQPQYMYAPNCYSYWRGPSYNNTYIRQTTIINNYYMDNNTRVRYNYGPRADVIQRDTRQPVQVYRVSQMRRPGAPVVQSNRVSIYRPTMDRNTQNTARPANVVQAPRQIGRPQAATNVSPGRQPEFRQQMQRQQGGGQPQNTGAANQRDMRSNNQANGRTQPQNTGVVSPRDPRGSNQANNRAQQAQPQQNRQQVQPQRTQPQVQPQPMRQQAQPQSRPEPQRAQPQSQPQSRPQPMRQQVQPQSRPEPQRTQPQMQQSRPQPQMQQSRPQMQPQARPQMQNAPRNEGGGRR